jgi:transcriptional regulator with XRE-family HTH domain
MQFLKISNEKNPSIGEVLRFWRKLKRISQMDLALDVGVSTKHLSFVETGRSKPSHNLVLKIAQALKLPLRHRNSFLKAAGYAAMFSEESFNGQKLEIVRHALKRMLEKHEPYPAFVINSAYKILMANSGYVKMIEFLAGKQVLTKYDNIYHLTFAEDGLRAYIKDWPGIKQFMLNRLLDEAVSTQNAELSTLYEEIKELDKDSSLMDFQVDDNLPILSLTFEKDAMQASFFTTITTLGSPIDLTTQELRIESLFPVDKNTTELFPLEIS